MYDTATLQKVKACKAAVAGVKPRFFTLKQLQHAFCWYTHLNIKHLYDEQMPSCTTCLLMQVVQKHMWSRYPPEPAGADDLRFEQLQQEEALQEKARTKVQMLWQSKSTIITTAERYPAPHNRQACTFSWTSSINAFYND